MREDDKACAARAAASEVLPGMLVGIGSGTTVAHLIEHLGIRVRNGLSISAVAASIASERAARAAGIVVRDFSEIASVDLAIDGVDEVDDALCAIKGGGGAMLREKIVATAATRMVAIADGSKRVAVLGTAPVPVEVLPFARTSVSATIERLGAAVVWRHDGADPYRTDQGNIVLDCTFPDLRDPAAVAARLSRVPGILGHGLFLDEIDALYVCWNGDVETIARPVFPQRAT